MGTRGMMNRGVGSLMAGLLLFATTPAMAESPAELISSFRLKHGEVRVVRDSTLDRIAMDQARAMAAKDDLSHDALGPFNRRVAPAGAGRAAENIAYGYDNFEKTLGQWIDSSGHRKNLLLHNASRVGIVQRSEEHTSELQSQFHIVCRLLLEKKNTWINFNIRFYLIALMFVCFYAECTT